MRKKRPQSAKPPNYSYKKPRPWMPKIPPEMGPKTGKPPIGGSRLAERIAKAEAQQKKLAGEVEEKNRLKEAVSI